MITPSFSIVQEDNFLKIIIRAPFANISETEIFIDHCEFRFYSKPYYLRLILPNEIVEDGRECANYESQEGVFTVRVPKKEPGQFFPDLDLLTKLLAPVGGVSVSRPNIEIIGETTGCESDNENSVTELCDEIELPSESCEDFDWQIEQEPWEELNISLTGPTYGFANQRSGVLQRLHAELSEIVDIKNADATPAEQRRKLRKMAEVEKFDEDHYLADLHDDEFIQAAINYSPPWYSVDRSTVSEEIVEFSSEEQQQLRQLPNKNFLLDKSELRCVLLGLVDIIFAYAYNHRVTEGEYTVESAWTIRKLSSTLSWFDSFHNVHEVVTACVRRSLCFPLFRHWQLSQLILRDVQILFHAGRRRLLKCLLGTHKLMLETESMYILNDLYITDYCVWIQQVKAQHLQKLAQELQKVTVSKVDVSLELEIIEQAGQLAADEGEGLDEMTQSLSNVAITSRSESIEANVLSHQNDESKNVFRYSATNKDSDDDSSSNKDSNKDSSSNKSNDDDSSSNYDSDDNDSLSNNDSDDNLSNKDCNDDLSVNKDCDKDLLNNKNNDELSNRNNCDDNSLSDKAYDDKSVSSKNCNADSLGNSPDSLTKVS